MSEGRLRVVVVGSGGREHALAAALARTADVVVSPGNPGMTAPVGGSGARIRCSSAPPEDHDADLWVIGPEAPLVDGLADRLRAGGRLVVGPGADGARLEGSKAWMKEVLADAGVPTASYRSFDAVGPALEWLRSLPAPWVVKTDGTRAVALAPAQDFKRAEEGDRGPNTGGMGAFSPVPSVDDAMVDHLMEVAVRPTLAALAQRGVDYRGVLYAGLMLTPSGPKVIEFNVRFGDPETQVVLPRWQGDVTAVLAAAAGGRLDTVAPPRFGSEAAVAVVLAAAGYPTAPRAGDPITGIEAANARPGVSVWAAGVAADPGVPGGLRTAGGRVLAVGATGADLAAARRRAYAAVDDVRWAGRHYRTDIALAASLASPESTGGSPRGEGFLGAVTGVPHR